MLTFYLPIWKVGEGGEDYRRTNSWSRESKPANTRPREQFPADGTSRESQAFRGLPFPPAILTKLLQLSSCPRTVPGIRVHAALAPRCHPPTLPVSLYPLRQRLRSRSACSPRHRPGAPSPSSPDHRAGFRTPPHTLRASSCCARATGPQSAVPILPGWCARPTERGSRAPELRPGVASACLAWPPS